jgi:hypothetical protein
MTTHNFSAVAMTIQEVLRPKEVGEQVVSHVLENVRQPEPDFEAMKRILSAPLPAHEAAGEHGEKGEGAR